MAARLRFLMLDGGEWFTEQSAHGLADEVAFEREFKCSAAVLSVASAKAQVWMAEVKVAEAKGEEPPEPDPSVFPRSEWLAFFAWRSLRRAHPGIFPARFGDFVESVDQMEFLPEEEATAPVELHEEETAAVLSNGSGLDPTDPGRRPTPAPFSSSMASATPTSN